MSEAEPSALPESWMTDFLAARQRDEEAGRAALAAACPRLAALGATEVRLAYEGCGDSGSVETVTATAGDQPIELPIELANELVAAAEQVLPSGWENDSGAFGELVLDVAAKTLSREHNWRIEDSEYDEERWNL